MQMPKATDELKARFHGLVTEGPSVEVKPMFGQLGAFVNGNMYAGMFGEQVGVKPAPDVLEELLALDGAGPFGPAERPMKGWVALPTSFSDAEATERIEQAREHVSTLPPKARKK